MAMTLEVARANLDAWMAASVALASGKEHRIHGRMIRHEDGAEIRRQIDYWQAWISRLENAAAGSGGYALASFPGE